MKAFMMNKIKYTMLLGGIALAILGTASCKKDYEAEPLENVTIDYVFDPLDSLGINAGRYLNGLYADMFPRDVSMNRISGNLLEAATDNAIPSNLEDNPAGRLLQGQYSAFDRIESDMVWGQLYENIRSATIFINNIDVVPLNDSKFEALPTGLTVKRTWKAEARFLRALAYFELLKRYGGIPLMGNDARSLDDQIELPRNSYSDCVDYIVSEMDAIRDSLLYYPVPNPSRNSHRATKGAAMALKVRVLLYAASPLFNGGNIDGANPVTGYTALDNNRWQRAADAAKEVIDLGTYALVDDVRKVFTEQYNSEILFFKQWSNNRDIENTNGPFGFGTQIGGQGQTSPTQELVDAFPMANGVPIDQSTTYDPNNPYVGRDPRFYETILYNGARWLGTNLQTYLGGQNRPGGSDLQTRTSYYMKKLMGDFEEAAQYSESQRDYILFRYTEVVLNYIEALNEAQGPVSEVLAQLKDLRRRAGVDAGDDGNFGLPTSANKATMRELIQNERRIELAFEEHRYWDIRRWKIAENKLNLPLHGMQILENGGQFTYSQEEVFQPRFTTAMYLYPIPDSEVLKNNNMEQNPGWN